MSAMRPYLVVVMLALVAASAALADNTIDRKTGSNTGQDAGVRADGGKVVVDVQTGTADTGDIDLDNCPAGTCCPPSTSKKLIMAASSVFAFLVLFFLMVRLVERVFIRQERSPLLGRHLGISLALLVGTAIAGGILYAVTGCWLPAYWYVLGAVGAAWLVHFLYTMFAVRK